MKPSLIIGMSGPGTSTMVRALPERGLDAIDIDSVTWCDTKSA